MTLHYHVTPITPNARLLSLAGRCFLVGWKRPDQLDIVTGRDGQGRPIASSILYDNNAYPEYVKAMEAFETAKASGQNVSIDDFIRTDTDWGGYYSWVDPLLDCPTSWAIIPDVIGAGSQEQDALLRQWPHGKERGAPVFHTDEPLDRLYRLLDEYPRVCIGSTGEHWRIWLPGREGIDLDPIWEDRMIEIWNGIAQRHKRTPYVHMLRGMALAGSMFPFASVDASSVGQNGHRPEGAAKMAQRFDAANAPPRWTPRKRNKHPDLFEAAA